MFDVRMDWKEVVHTFYYGIRKDQKYYRDNAYMNSPMCVVPRQYRIAHRVHLRDFIRDARAGTISEGTQTAFQTAFNEVGIDTLADESTSRVVFVLHSEQNDDHSNEQH